MIRSSAWFFVSFVASVVPLGAQGANVLVVDANNGPGTNYTNLQAAIDAAAEGDLLLVRAGSYQATISAKSLVVQAETLNTATLTGLSILDLAAGQFVLVRGFRGIYNNVGIEPLVEDCAGSVRIEESTLYGLDCARAVDLVLSKVQVKESTPPVMECQGGIEAQDSALYVYESIVQGPSSYDAGPTTYTCYAEPGIYLRNSSLFLHGSYVAGGNEDRFQGPGAFYCSAPGLVSDGKQPVEITGGGVKAGKTYTCTLPPAIVGITPVYRAGTPRRVSSPSPVLEGQPTSVQVRGDPGDSVFLAVSLSTAPARYYTFAGFAFAPPGSTTYAFVGVIDATGILTWSLNAPTFSGPGFAATVFLQGFFAAPSGEKQISRPTGVNVLDPAY